MNAKLLAAAATALLTMAGVASAADILTLNSPNGTIRFRLALEAGGRLTYGVTMKSKPVIEQSALLMSVDGVNLSQDVEAGKPQPYRVNERYEWNGAYSAAVDHCNGAKIALKHKKSGTAYTLEVRAYDDGIAFRHIIPGPDGKARVPDESTAFRISAGSTVWFHDFEGHYEALHAKKAIGEVKSGEWAAPPVTFKLPGDAGYGSITEGGLFRYAGMGLQADGNSGFNAKLGHAIPASYPFRLRYKDDVERMTKPAPVNGTITTPWRIVMAAPDLNTLVNCSIVNDVAPPPDKSIFPKGARTAWIKPGRAVWKYLDGGGENNLEIAKEFSRLAGELGFEYQVVEGFWSRWPEQDLKSLVDYSRERGVGIILWKHSRDMRTPEQRRAFFELCSRNGVAGSKIDFFDHEAKEVVELYEECLREAARFKQVLNFHGANKPAGESRTWPNELTREAIRGMESRKSLRAQHDATLPFTRMLAGHADYTPMVFTERRNDTTWAHQVASAATLTSPLLVYGGHPRSILDNPAVDVIKSIPSVWDQTIALPLSVIGEVSVLARRRGETWFLAVMNGPVERTIEVPLSFLADGNYRGDLVRDDDTKPDAVRIERTELTRTGKLTIRMQAGGGFVGRFRAKSGT